MGCQDNINKVEKNEDADSLQIEAVVTKDEDPVSESTKASVLSTYHYYSTYEF